MCTEIILGKDKQSASEQGRFSFPTCFSPVSTAMAAINFSTTSYNPFVVVCFDN